LATRTDLTSGLKSVHIAGQPWARPKGLTYMDGFPSP
jgi:hypothetical protein